MSKLKELLDIQAAAQARWAQERPFEVDAPAADGPDAAQPKYLATFPYPYMNGRLHLGHTFTVSKPEFAVGYQRLKGVRALFPFGLHCTGMPIKAAADKLVREISQYGNPPILPPVEPKAADSKPQEKAAVQPGVFRSKKSKAVAKSGAPASQWALMRSIGLRDDEIAAFADSHKWLEYFPPHAKADLQLMGLKADWRRSFITTAVNPFYDSFVRWQFNKLRALGKIEKGTRYAVFSTIDNQPCADHDRASGEGANPQEYTCIKMALLAPFPEALQALAERKVFLVAATLRPETMYGQTNFYVLPSGTYGAYEMKNGDVFVMSHHAARNFSYQGLLAQENCTDPKPLVTVSGDALLGCAVSSPLTKYERIYCWPMLNVSMEKGTGVVTSVPSDSPDDYMSMMDLRNKEPMRRKFHLTDDMVMPFEPIPIIETPDFGDFAAKFVCEQLKIASQNDREKLAQAKDMVYLKGFYDGKLVAGPYAGQPVKDIKDTIKNQLISEGLAVKYSEPERKVVSRSGDVCVVALTDQWFIKYGEPEWREQARKCLKAMETYHTDCFEQLNNTLDWMHEWACSREFGLGTRLPWDPQYLIESLSDSTIYMSYYTVVHLLEGDSEISPAQVNDDVWNYILLDGPLPADCTIPEAKLQRMRAEFNYWYPVDLRVSGKDLIQNHLTMFIYNHVAIFPESKWPRSIRANGHVLLNGEKMSKSTGNFLTLEEAVNKYSADGMRVALADAGDSMDDANYMMEQADAALLRLHTFYAWAKDVVAGNVPLRDGPADHRFDQIFDAQMNECIGLADVAYNRMLYREALKSAFFDLQNHRDLYRKMTEKTLMNRSLVMRFIEVQCLLLSPIAPHTCEHVWGILGHPESIMQARWPEQSATGVDAGLLRAGQYLQNIAHSLRKQLEGTGGKRARPGKGAAPAPVGKPTHAYVYVARQFPEWRSVIATALTEMCKENNNQVPPKKDISTKIATLPPVKAFMKMAMPFVDLLLTSTQHSRDGPLDFSLSVPFDEFGALQDAAAVVGAELGLELEVFLSDDDQAPGPADTRATAEPLEPAAHFFTK